MDKETKKIWGLKQNKKAPKLWHENERLWVGVYKVAKVQEVKIVSGKWKHEKFCALWEKKVSKLNPRK